MFFSKAISGFLFLQFGYYGDAQPPNSVPCNQAACNAQSQALGFKSFYVGDFPAKGCFSKGVKAYFGTGGTIVDQKISPLSGEKKRITCNPKTPTKAPTPTPKPIGAPPSQTTCLTQVQCDLKSKELGFTNFRAGDYPVNGCFSKGNTAYFGRGGTLEQKSESPLSGLKMRIPCDASSINQTPSPTNKPTPPPTNQPTPSPTKKPTPAPFNVGTSDIDCDSGLNRIEIEVNTDGPAANTGFRLSTIPEDSPVLEFSSLPSSEFVQQVCVSDGNYTLTVSGRASSYSAKIDGEEVLEEVLYGRNPPGVGNAVSHTILAGKDADIRANMSDDEKEWLDEHNIHREAFHTAQNTEYRRLQWSPELAKDALAWVDAITPECSTIIEPNVEEGENLSVQEYSTEQENERPLNIVNRWTQDPDSLTSTQVMWRATRHVGCSNKEVVEDGKHCYVSICRYSRPGNCNVASLSRQEAADEDRTFCGPVCPDDGCH
mmetsp:Transcript_43696/g.78440  ORF Transcript_43696/g.78440 Transcript_43696/m.78440 type:complete len:487 (+) Transcript_43696:74-1534(+)